MGREGCLLNQQVGPICTCPPCARPASPAAGAASFKAEYKSEGVAINYCLLNCLTHLMHFKQLCQKRKAQQPMTQQQWLTKNTTAHAMFPILQGFLFFFLVKKKHPTVTIYYFEDWLPQIHQFSWFKSPFLLVSAEGKSGTDQVSIWLQNWISVFHRNLSISPSIHA